MTTSPWLLLIHQIPRTPDYLRVKIGRRLQRVGAVAIKSSVYVLPASDQALEDFQWVMREIVDGGGDASICQATFVDGLTDADVRRLLDDARLHDFEEISAQLRILLKAVPAGRRVSEDRAERLRADAGRLHKRLDAIAKIDFYDARGRSAVDTALRELESRLTQSTRAPAGRRGRKSAVQTPHGRTWITRRGIFVDRIASAWLIRRFIDPEAHFVFVDPAEHAQENDGIRFDMFDGEYTHEGDRCTFETLLRRFDVRDTALEEIAAIVHDIDVKDAKFGRDDAAGIERVLSAVAASTADDNERLTRGSQLFDELYLLFGRAGRG